MATETATSQETAVPSSESELNALLGGAGPESSSAEATQTEESAAETETDTPETGSEEAGEEAGKEEAPEEEAEAEEAEEEAAEEESEFSIDENDRDYSEAAYKKAADHYSKTYKVQLDPNDPAHHALLKEVIDRGEALKRQQAERAEAEAKGDDEKPEEKVEAAAQPTKPTPEQIQAFIKNAGEVAKARVVPEVSMHVATTFVKALWGDEAPEKLSQQQADGITTALSQAFWMQLEDALPAIYNSMRGALGNDPVIGRVETMAIREAAFEHLDGLTDKATGKQLYPNLEQMVESGAIQRAMQSNAWIKNVVAGNGRDRVANYAAQVEAAYKIARGEQVNPETVQKAVQTGKKQEAERAKKIAAGRTTPGKTKGEIGKGPSPGQQTVNEIVSGGGSKFSHALATAGRVIKRPGS